jgi:hypothetical protein
MRSVALMIDIEPRPLAAKRRSKLLEEAFAEVNLASAERERTAPDTPAHTAAVRRERAAAERVAALIDPTRSIA